MHFHCPSYVASISLIAPYSCRDLVGLGVPKLRALFLEIFGHHTASNNGAWLRRKLCEKPDAERGRGRSASIRKRDIGAAIWTTGAVKNITQVQHFLLLSF
jgi:hypothetical protein